jgi:hypothetical protein
MKRKNITGILPLALAVMGMLLIIFSGCKKKESVPELTTAAVTSVTASSAVSGGTITSDGGSAVTAYGVCWGTSADPTTSGSKTLDGSGSGTFTSNLSGLAPNTTYYIRAYATNGEGTAYGDCLSFTTSSIAVGQSYGGGIVFYISGGHGLIAAASDQGASNPWGCNGTLISGADGTAVGTGNQNTIDILIGCSTPGTAAYICANLSLGGYDDWYLPSKDELNLLYSQKDIIGGFSGVFYWSSTEVDAVSAWGQFFDMGGSQTGGDKGLAHRVRAIRSF